MTHRVFPGLRDLDDITTTTAIPQCPVKHSPSGQHFVLGHPEVAQAAAAPDTFSASVSPRVSVPNSMDGAEHAAYRTIIDSYFTAARMATFEPTCRAITRDLMSQLTFGAPTDVMDTLAQPFANRVQSAFMGWPTTLQRPLEEWVRKNHAATRAQDRAAMIRVATEFDGYIVEQLQVRRNNPTMTDVTADLVRETRDGVPLTDEQLVSLIRNWTVGELATIAASVGIIVAWLAAHPRESAQVRDLHALGLDMAVVSDEILRLHSPFLASRRRTTTDTTVAGDMIAAESRVNLMWATANLDPRAFPNPLDFDPLRNQDANVLYGHGTHYCPGKPLAHLELRIILDELFTHTTHITPAWDGDLPRQALYPTAGFTEVPVILHRTHG